MTKRYTGGVVSSAVPTVNAATASGVFLLSQQADAQAKNNWPPFKVEKSLRFRAASSAYLSRTPATAGNRKTWTFSAWVKRGALSVDNTILNAGYSTNPWFILAFAADNTLAISATAGTSASWKTTALFRDPAAWYHVVCVVDTTSSTATITSTSTDRIRLYVNGVQYALASGTVPTQNSDLQVNNTVAHTVGGYSSEYYDGYMSEVYLIGGQALTPSSFGGTDKDGNWSPIAYTGTFGQNGFYLNFKDATSTTTLGYDYSGNGNHWTSSGISVTAGATYDSMIDVPEDQAGANTRGNYCTLNPLTFWNSIGGGSLTNGNLTLTADSGNNRDTRAWGTMGVSTGKWYYETTVNTVDSTYMSIGVSNYILGANTGFSYGSNWVYHSDGTKLNSANPVDTGTSYGNTYTTNDIIGVAVDMDNGKIWFSKNGTWQASGDPVAGTNAAYTNLTSTTVIPFTYQYAAGSQQSPNFGQRPFTYTPPAGFKTLNTYNLPEPTIKQPNKHFDVKTWSGNSSTQSIPLEFAPDLIWNKSRSAASGHSWWDVLRGTGAQISSNQTDAETTGYNAITSFSNNAINLGADNTGSFNGRTNETGRTYVGWAWKANGAGVTNTAGTRTSQVSVNTTSGFSVVTFNSGSAGNQSFGHGLGVTPAFFVIKKTSGTSYWDLWHKSFSSPATNYMYLDLTNAVASDARQWANTAPNSTVISYESGYEFAANTNFVAYCWSEIAGYSAFGSYIGNGNDPNGPFIYTGFRPKFIFRKCSSTAGENSMLYDSAVNPYNASQEFTAPNLADASNTVGGYFIDILSNGFRIRHSATGNNSGRTYIYAAFAEMPFKYARSR